MESAVYRCACYLRPALCTGRCIDASTVHHFSGEAEHGIAPSQFILTLVFLLNLSLSLYGVHRVAIHFCAPVLVPRKGQAGLIRLSARGIASFWLTSRKMTRFARGSRFSPSVPNPRIQNFVPRAAVPITSALVGDPVSAGTDKRADKHRYDALYALHSRSLQPQLQLIHGVHRYLPHSAWIVPRPWTLPTAVSCVHVQVQVWPNADPDWTETRTLGASRVEVPIKGTNCASV